MAIRREFKTKEARKRFMKANHLVASSRLGGGGNEIIYHGAFYPTKKTPKKLKETKGSYK